MIRNIMIVKKTDLAGTSAKKVTVRSPKFEHPVYMEVSNEELKTRSTKFWSKENA